MTEMSKSSPWMTKREEAACKREVRKKYAELRQRNPALMRRLRKLSIDQLDRLELALLETEEAQARLTGAPLDRESAYQIRMLRELLWFRDHPAPAKSTEVSSPVAASQANETVLPAVAAAPEHAPEASSGLSEATTELTKLERPEPANAQPGNDRPNNIVRLKDFYRRLSASAPRRTGRSRDGGPSRDRN